MYTYYFDLKTMLFTFKKRNEKLEIRDSIVAVKATRM